LNKRELGMLSRAWGPPTKNPDTGLPEFFLGELFSWIAPVAASAIGAAPVTEWLDLGGDALGGWGQSLVGAGLGALTSNALNSFRDPLGDTLKGGALGGVTPTAARMLGFSGYESPFNVAGLFGTAVPETVVGNSTNPNISGSGADAVAGTVAKAAGDKGAAAASPGWLANNKWAIPAALAAVGMLSAGNSRTSGTSPTVAPPQRPASWANYKFPTASLNRRRNPAADRNEPQMAGETSFFEDNRLPDVPITAAARGGMLSDPYMQGGAGDGRADTIPARLSNNEYVIDAETVAMLGNGSPDAGAKLLDQFRKNIRKHKGAALAKGKFSPDAKPVERYMRSGA
jgi:hypothetical protein